MSVKITIVYEETETVEIDNAEEIAPIAREVEYMLKLQKSQRYTRAEKAKRDIIEMLDNLV